MGDLAGLRRSIIALDVPLLLDDTEIATALDIPVRAVWERFENMVMDQGAGTFRYLVRAVKVREALLAMRPKSKPAPPAIRSCLSCHEPIHAGARRGTRFCSSRCAKMTPSQRARLLENRALSNPAETLGIETHDFAGTAGTAAKCTGS
jgi:hypothetical protein